MREGLKYGTFRVRGSFRAVESTSGSRRSTVLLLVPVPSLPNFIIINFQRTYRHTTSIVAVGTCAVVQCTILVYVDLRTCRCRE